MNDREKRILVYADWTHDGPTLIGELYASVSKGRETFSFAYDKGWLSHGTACFSLDPDLALYQGRQFVPLDKPLFGLFADSCPDRWGRLLMRRREAVNARKEQRKPKQLAESDYLLGVYDEARMGALRFSVSEGGPFLAWDRALATPPWTTLRELETAAYAFEQDDDSLNEKWLNQLLAPGSSLGGARPKATVQAPDGALWIAKFPSKHDDYNAGAWEMVVHDLALQCGLRVPEARLETFSKNGGTYLVKRFDRQNGKRVHFASAMTLLGKVDGAAADDGTGYLDLAAFIRQSGASPKEDLAELWHRVVFTMAVSNTDDHLRNHGFLLTPTGWRLSPMFDVNPSIYGDSLSLNVSAEDNSISFELALETAAYYGLMLSDAREHLEKIKDVVSQNWKSAAKGHGLSRSAIEFMEPAFEMAYK